MGDTTKIQSELFKHVDLWTEAKARQREADNELKRLKVEVAAAKSRFAVEQVAEIGSAEDLSRFLHSGVLSW